jgi:hypothetical protein
MIFSPDSPGRSTATWIEPMNILSRDKQIEIIAALCEGVGQRAAARLADVDRKTVARLALQVGKGCAELHDRRIVGLRVARIELDEVWSFVGKKQKRVERHEAFAKGDQYTYIALAGTQKAIISYRIGKRDGHNTDEFVQDLRGRVLGAPEISTDGSTPTSFRCVTPSATAPMALSSRHWR